MLLRELTIKNYKSIQDLTLELGWVNVLIGENGCGKSNILEAIAFLGAVADGRLDYESLDSRGIRLAKPALTFNSFKGDEQYNEVSLKVRTDSNSSTQIYSLTANELNNIRSSWHETNQVIEKDDNDFYEKFAEFLDGKGKPLERVTFEIAAEERGLNPLNLSTIDLIKGVLKHYSPEARFLKQFLIYDLHTSSLRGIATPLSKKDPLGIYGEGLDLFISQLNQSESQQLKEYAYLISWLEDFFIDENDAGKFEGHKLGKSRSLLYFKDRFMQGKNNIFSAENANEGILHVLFYLVLFISKETPSFFGIDNIETALNPQLCRHLMKELSVLAKKNEKQAIITTHNPAILDGLDLTDDEIRLFEIRRLKNGQTDAKRIQFKKGVDTKKFKLSEMWMKGMLGAIPQNF